MNWNIIRNIFPSSGAKVKRKKFVGGPLVVHRLFSWPDQLALPLRDFSMTVKIVFILKNNTVKAVAMTVDYSKNGHRGKHKAGVKLGIQNCWQALGGLQKLLQKSFSIWSLSTLIWYLKRLKMPEWNFKADYRV